MRRLWIMLPLFAIVFWNLRNLMDYREATDSRYSSKSAFYRKCSRITKAVMKISDDCGDFPEILAFAEVEDRFVLNGLLHSTVLDKAGYRIVHFESPDSRGIDCALMYRVGTMKLLSAQPCHIYNPDGSVMQTRDILAAVFQTDCGDTVGVLVNHHPSKLHNNSALRRESAMSRMRFVADSLLGAGCLGVIAVGDFNDTVQGDGFSYKYNGRWDRIDGCHCFGDLVTEQTVCNLSELSTEDKTHGGQKPWNEISDHYPVLFKVFSKEMDTFDAEH